MEKSIKPLHNLLNTSILYGKKEIIAYDDKNLDQILTFANMAD
jgi:hypothetical protein